VNICTLRRAFSILFPNSVLMNSTRRDYHRTDRRNVIIMKRNASERRQDGRCAHETPLGFRAPTTISPIRLRLLGEMVAHLAQGCAPRPHRNAEIAHT
jgi:hypothetical protein